jgi:hypothetical protein
VPNETHLTITIPGTVSPTTLGPLRDRLEHAVQSCLAAPCDIREGSVTLHRDDARLAGYAMLHALRLHEIITDEFPQLGALRHADRIRRLSSGTRRRPADRATRRRTGALLTR